MAGSAAASMPVAEPVLLTGGYACFAFLAFFDCAILPTDP